jgi:hypothetical protein
MYNNYQNLYCWDNGEGGFDDWGNTNYPTEAQYNVYDNIQCWDNGANGIALCNMKGGTLSNSLANGNGAYGMYFFAISDFSINNCSTIDSTLYGIYLTSSKNINSTNVIVKNNSQGIIIKNCIDTVLTSCQSYDDRVTPLQGYGLYLAEINTGISLLNCTLTPNKSGDIYNPNSVAVTIITEKMLAKL